MVVPKLSDQGGTLGVVHLYAHEAADSERERERERVSERDDIKMDVLETAAMERSVKNQPHIGCLNLLLKQNGCPDQHLINPKQY
jgi:hypothetical protein